MLIRNCSPKLSARPLSYAISTGFESRNISCLCELGVVFCEVKTVFQRVNALKEEQSSYRLYRALYKFCILL